MGNVVSVLSIGIAGIMHRRWFIAIDALSGQSELGSLAVESCIRWRAPSRAPRGSGVGNRKTWLTTETLRGTVPFYESAPISAPLPGSGFYGAKTLVALTNFSPWK